MLQIQKYDDFYIFHMKCLNSMIVLLAYVRYYQQDYTFESTFASSIFYKNYGVIVKVDCSVSPKRLYMVFNIPKQPNFIEVVFTKILFFSLASFYKF